MTDTAGDTTTRRSLATGLHAWQARFESFIRNAPVVIFALDPQGIFTFSDGKGLETLGLAPGEVVGRSALDIYAGFPDVVEKIKRALAGELQTAIHDMGRWVFDVHYGPIHGPGGVFQGVVGVATDITARHRAETELRRIEWMLSRSAGDPGGQRLAAPPSYGSLVALNRSRQIVDAVGEPTLTDIVGDCLDLLDSSAAIYEKNGDYALGIYASGWCRFLDEASRRLCRTTDNGEALASGRWHCHESCWTNTSKPALERGEAVDAECLGGLRLYAVPIRAGNEIVGAMNVGYGDPPRDPDRLAEIAARYEVSTDDLAALAAGHESRPPFVVEMAKRRLAVSARLIGEIVDRRRVEASLARSEERMRLALSAANQGFYDLNVQTGEATVSREYATMLGYEPDEFHETNAAWLERLHPDDRERVSGVYRDYVAGRIPAYEVEFRSRCKSGEWIWLLSLGRVVERDADGAPLRMLGTHTDITARKRAEEQEQRLHAQLLQAQKMESVGRLAGGVAHDFNNMLTTILGHAELAMGRPALSPETRADLEAITEAGTRSARLVKQLLGFARKQTAAPKVLHLNDTVGGTLNMLHRLIGEDIQLAWKPGADLWPVKIDPSQVDQILTNLCVNARDAIRGVGKVTIETGNAVIDQAYAKSHPGTLPGHYVMLAVSDDGSGMSAEVLEHLFEPFFSTKAAGQGTGLGLATVYGLVKQNSGFVNVYSEPGIGSTFKIYLPRTGPGTAEPRGRSESATPLGHGETVLLVEDDDGIRRLAVEMLQRLGYRVLAAATPAEAIGTAAAHASAIALLVTDVILPEMNGRELSDRLRAALPGLRCLYTSGYTSNVIAHRGVLDEGLHFLPKPFSMSELGRRVRQALDEGPTFTR